MAEIVYHCVLITDGYLRKYSPLPDNYDLTEIRPFIHPAEKIWIEPVLGTPLYEELLEQVERNEVTEENSLLLLNVYPLLSFAVCYEAMPFISYHFSTVGVTAGKSDNSDHAGISAVNYITERLRSQIETMKRLLRRFLDENAALFPLYKSEGGCDCSCGGDDRWIWDYYTGSGSMDRYDVQRWMNHCRIRSNEPRPNAMLWGLRRGSVSVK